MTGVFIGDDGRITSNAAHGLPKTPVRIDSLKRHVYVPERMYPWFCAECGYPKHEKLKHL